MFIPGRNKRTNAPSAVRPSSSLRQLRIMYTCPEAMAQEGMSRMTGTTGRHRWTGIPSRVQMGGAMTVMPLLTIFVTNSATKSNQFRYSSDLMGGFAKLGMPAKKPPHIPTTMIAMQSSRTPSYKQQHSPHWRTSFL
ncbi:unnamed protein product [Prorocentrum cordatum]|uniref:Uncharacterized protein n=1 Tax=Prorocentrum cordatum TaxID=2364126 RepID=A0ABN9WWC0_9DINO|nr:unnamed protein product [Polarella glacialis]